MRTIAAAVALVVTAPYDGDLKSGGEGACIDPGRLHTHAAES